MPQFRRVAAPSNQTGEPETGLRVLDDGCPAIGYPKFLGSRSARMKHKIRTRDSDFAPQRVGRAFDAIGQTQRNTAFWNELSQESDQVDVVIRRVLFSHRRLYKMRVTPGTRSAFSDEAEPDSLRCFR